jgi:hypothetical protein
MNEYKVGKRVYCGPEHNRKHGLILGYYDNIKSCAFCEGLSVEVFTEQNPHAIHGKKLPWIKIVCEDEFIFCMIHKDPNNNEWKVGSGNEWKASATKTNKENKMKTHVEFNDQTLVEYNDLPVGVLAEIKESPAWQNVIVMKIIGGIIVPLHIPPNNFTLHNSGPAISKVGVLVFDQGQETKFKFKILPSTFKLTLSNEE